MEELVEYADKLTVRDEEGELRQIGFVPDLFRSHTDLYARMYGGSFYGDNGTAVTLSAQPVVDALNWQRQFYERYGAEEVVEFASSLNRYLDSGHPVYAGRRLSCQQCHRNPPRKSDRLPDHSFYAGKVAMVVGGAWQVGENYAHLRPELNYGVAPFPPPADHPARANTTVVEGTVTILPTGARDKEEAARLLAWMMSPQVMAEATYAHAILPSRRTAAEDPRFLNTPGFEVFVELLAHPNAAHTVTTPISPEVNEALARVEAEVLHGGNSAAALLLDEVQVELAPRLEGTLRQSPPPLE
jgi:multiple sugar transport system substrate-binding protein